eukprot:1158545-Pelagomonas_calceolata.AAC.11
MMMMMMLCAAADDAWKLCCWTVADIGGDWRSSVQMWSYTREGATQEGNVHSKKDDTGRACAQKCTHTAQQLVCIIRVSSGVRARTQMHTLACHNSSPVSSEYNGACCASFASLPTLA